MNSIKFECNLLTDLVISQRAASDGPQETLDFIPGSNFLGIVASQLYDKLSPEQQILIFHSGKVRFGDAHPMLNSNRALRIPFSMFRPKSEKPKDEYYIHHQIEDFDKLREKQIKQCRSGFYCFTGEKTFYKIKLETSFAIKSAHDQKRRCSQDEQMYGYQSLNEGCKMCFEIEFDDELSDELKKEIVQALTTGKKRVGRSRTAQYGLIEIREKSYEEPITVPASDNIVFVYAESRLIFFDEYNQPIFQPSVKQLLGEEFEGDVLWEKSQIRSFQYAPWNFKRQARDLDRTGIEKGSVFVIALKNTKQGLSGRSTIGKYKNEGFGRIIINPAFLTAAEGSNGKALYQLVELNDCGLEPDQTNHKLTDADNKLLAYLRDREQQETKELNLYIEVNKFRKANKVNKDLFKNNKFSSQWGAIRSIALRETDDSTISKEIDSYISHGVKASDWEGERKKVLKDFMTKIIGENKNLREAIINLASEMGKAGKQKGK